MAQESRKRTRPFKALPEGCIAKILSHTTPIDACRLSIVSKAFGAAAKSDAVWNQFLPSDSIFLDSITSRSPSLAKNPTKKALFLALCHRPIIIDGGKHSFQLDKKSGKICYMLSARALNINCGNTGDPVYSVRPKRKWISEIHTRFPGVAILYHLSRPLDIHGMIKTLSLSPNTHYAAFLVFNTLNSDGFENQPIRLSVGVEGGHCITKSVYLYPNVEHKRNRNLLGYMRLQRPCERSDGWLEIEMGKFFNSSKEEHVHMSVIEKTSAGKKTNFVLEGIEIRPMKDN